MNSDEIWAAIDDQRRRTANLLETLTAEQWDHPSLCDGWSVRHVAAHLTPTMQQQRIRDAISFMASHPKVLRAGSLNGIIHDSAVLLAAELSEAEIIGRIRGMEGLRRHNAFVTERGSLIDILVHGQDIALPLGLTLDMPAEAAAEAAERVWATRHTWLGVVFRNHSLDPYRLTATDTDWSVGEGLDVRASAGALLLLMTGRTARIDELEGAGADELRRSLVAG
ncbi:hypothetical protein N802_00370 [Knoellia sinensis KCTC 19936]|uniref:Mycothiol-dependent maleylpyruvate isomerase metal-binding domain-containing protein n=1 Tax=Knoellia sinensis KCTC 19936 TaxID=1385520 RepID=A0A0A0JEX8_9MICO|nr:maleylpyruvate isomerase family mycothiol-dependent enzyme [Knoellia sinensis]KGN34587.1 hypothetical protein N802_00370 [Knoellia sinensis KCTC 19936]